MSTSQDKPPEQRGGALERAARYGFVVSLLWIGFVLAISFFEAPLRARAPSMTETTRAELGHVARHGLNRAETLFAALLLVALRVGRPTTQLRLAFAGAALVFASQTVLLYTRIDARTMSIVDGSPDPLPSYEPVYLGLELVKLGFLAALTWLQVRDLVGDSESRVGGDDRTTIGKAS